MFLSLIWKLFFEIELGHDEGYFNLPFWRRLDAAGDFKRALNWEKLFNLETDIFTAD